MRHTAMIEEKQLIEDSFRTLFTYRNAEAAWTVEMARIAGVIKD
jgi:hypothetical protein